jgi:hypothetical protein
MLGRALSLATVTLVIGCLTAVAVRAVENLEAGKSPSQIFAGTCNACHKSPRGLLKTVPASSLPGFLRQHYTTSSDMASVLASFLVSNGAADPRFQAKEAKQGKDGAKEAAKDARQEAATRPDQADPNRNAKQRLPRPYEAEATRPDHVPAQAAIDAKQGLKQKQGKKGRPAEEPAKTEPPAEAPKTETAKGDDSGKPEGKNENGKNENGKTETAKVDAPKEAVSEPSGRPDPVPPVTPAPAATAPASTAASSTPSEAPAGSSAPPAQAAQPTAPAVAVAPSLPPVPPAGPPAPPISQ